MAGDPPTVWPTVAATGHRDIPAASGEWLRTKLTAGAHWLRDEHGTQVGISGMALGADLAWARAVLDAGLELWAYVPFPGQAARWPPESRTEWRRLLDQAAAVKTISDADPTSRGEAARLLHARNHAMLVDADALIAVYDPDVKRGGTHSAVSKAGRLPGVWLDPTTRTVHTVRPGGFPPLAHNQRRT